MIRHLPPDSALIREASLGWSTEFEFFAGFIEELRNVHRATLLVGGAKRHQLPPPIEIPRPKPEVISRETYDADGNLVSVDDDTSEKSLSDRLAAKFGGKLPRKDTADAN